ncbi:hypothetical protein V6N13_059524 [Hibiscus sabdariffa]|uniref:Uncharacterized protein n=1 Tax=Hibiscus sabdariffa TaxID=183260 RepID=A0ABR2GCU7_9ROSI
MVVCILCVVHVEGPVGAALRPGAIQGGASFVWLASCPCDSLGSPRLEPELPPLCLGFHSASESRPIDLGKWFSLDSPQCPACSCIAGALSVALCGARPWPPLEVPLHVAQPLVGYGVKCAGLVPRFGRLARLVHWPSRLHRLWVRWTLPWMLLWLSPVHRLWVPWTWPWMLPWPPDNSVACCTSSRLYISPTIFAGPWLRSHRCAPCNAQGALLPRPGCLLPQLAARFAKALPWPVRHSLAWCASHPWAGYSAPPHAAGVNPTAPVTSSAPPGRPSTLASTFPAPPSEDHEHDSYNPMIHSATSDMLEDALAIPTDCALLVDIDGIIQSNGEDLVHGAIDEATDTLIREVAASVLGCTPLSVSTDATVASVTSAAMSTTSPTAPWLSRSASACARRLPMPRPVLE